MHEACGIFASITSSPREVNVADITCSGLLSLQHRGQESAGITISDGCSSRFQTVKNFGLVTQVFDEAELRKLSGGVAALGHVRYSTNGAKDAMNCIQPFVLYTQRGTMAIAHNGELSNVKTIKKLILQRGIGLSTDTDSELIGQLIASSDCDSYFDTLQEIMKHLSTSYSLIIMLTDRLLAIRDPWGNRPLCIGCISGEDSTEKAAWLVSSESCAFSCIPGAGWIREAKPGEIIEIRRNGISRTVIVPRPNSDPPAFCIFEYVYFARIDSFFEGQQVHSVRYRCGIQLAKEAPAFADLISTVPSSATPAALGYSRQIGILYQEILCKSNYVGRSFIQPCDKSRKSSISQKFAPLADNYKNRRIVLVDDSIVRGNTMASVVKLLKNTGVAEVHLRIASPPVRHPCYFGINIPTNTELLAHGKSTTEIAKFLGADSVEYLSIDGLLKAVTPDANPLEEIGYCTACLTGNYPVELNW